MGRPSVWSEQQIEFGGNFSVGHFGTNWFIQLATLQLSNYFGPESHRGDLGGKSRDTWTVNLVPDGCRRRLKKFCWLADGEWNGRRLINVKNLWFSADGSTLNFGRVCASWPQLSCLFPSGNWCRNFPFFGGNSSYRSI